MKKVIFIPTIKECQQIFPDVQLNEWQHGILKGIWNHIDIYISGISKTNTAFSTTMVLSENKMDAAYLIGIAGAYRGSDISVGDVVTVQHDSFVDEGMIVDGVLSMTSEMGFPVCDENVVHFTLASKFPVVDANTVSWLSSSDDLAAMYSQKTGASVESMEGAAFGLVCQKMNVAAYQIRSISNFCGDRNQQEWNIKKAFKSLQKTMVELI